MPNGIDPTDLGGYGITYKRWYQDIADAIRTVNQTNEVYYPPQMAAAILALNVRKKVVDVFVEPPVISLDPGDMYSTAYSLDHVETSATAYIPMVDQYDYDPPIYSIAHLQGNDPLLSAAKAHMNIYSIPLPTVTVVSEASEYTEE